MSKVTTFNAWAAGSLARALNGPSTLPGNGSMIGGGTVGYSGISQSNAVASTIYQSLAKGSHSSAKVALRSLPGLRRLFELGE